MKILIVDDNEIFRDSVAVLLDFHGHKYEFAASGKEALEKVRKFQPKAIILDVMMPGMDGVEVCRTIKSDPRLKHIYVLMLSGKDSEDDINRAKNAGSDDYIIKPYSPTEVVEKITRLA